MVIPFTRFMLFNIWEHLAKRMTGLLRRKWHKAGPRQDTHVFRTKGDWRLTTGRQVRTRWVEFEPVR